MRCEDAGSVRSRRPRARPRTPQRAAERGQTAQGFALKRVLSPFRRRRPLHERLADDAGFDIGGTHGAPSSAETYPPPSGLAGLAHALAGGGLLVAPPDLFGNPSPLGEVVLHGVARPRRWDAVASAEAELHGHEHEFVTLADGTLVVEGDVPDGALFPLADAVEAGGLRPPYRALAVRRDRRMWGVGAVAIEVRELPGEEDDEFERVEDGVVVRGRRIDGDLWEVEESRL